LGPRKRAVKMFHTFDDGAGALQEKDLQRIHAPAGLDTGAASPEEIALSMAAEIRSFFSTGMRHR